MSAVWKRLHKTPRKIWRYALGFEFTARGKWMYENSLKRFRKRARKNPEIFFNAEEYIYCEIGRYEGIRFIENE